jgi:hypothetical protein
MMNSPTEFRRSKSYFSASILLEVNITNEELTNRVDDQ